MDVDDLTPQRRPVGYIQLTMRTVPVHKMAFFLGRNSDEETGCIYAVEGQLYLLFGGPLGEPTIGEILSKSIHEINSEGQLPLHARLNFDLKVGPPVVTDELIHPRPCTEYKRTPYALSTSLRRIHRQVGISRQIMVTSRRIQERAAIEYGRERGSLGVSVDMWLCQRKQRTVAARRDCGDRGLKFHAVRVNRKCTQPVELLLEAMDIDVWVLPGASNFAKDRNFSAMSTRRRIARSQIDNDSSTPTPPDQPMTTFFAMKNMHAVRALAISGNHGENGLRGSLKTVWMVSQV
ncbi:hypothetical protein OF83DRAFT_1088198 [Amylostereum chailletii]|nr:hypothetical protein OF83DRAFT_1088198 [Amylostereum chailletii]